MFADPLFIIGLLGMTVCLYSWIKFSIEQNEVEPIIVKYISTISFISGAALLLSIFYNSGNLDIVLLFASIIAFIVMTIGFFLKNTEITSTAKGYFLTLIHI